MESWPTSPLPYGETERDYHDSRYRPKLRDPRETFT